MKNKIELVKRDDNKTFDEGYDEFITYCKARNLRPATIKHYDGIINCSWYKFIYYKTLVKDITPQTIEDYVIFCRGKVKDVTINTNIRAIKAILYYFMRLGYMKEFKIQCIKFDKEPIETYSEEELKILLRKPDLKNNKFIEYRNWVIYNFLLGTGCRVQTLVNIKIKDLDCENDLFWGGWVRLHKIA